MTFPLRQPVGSIVIYDQAGNELTVATEATLEAARVLLASLDGKDYATQTTLATLATEATLEAARVLLVSLDGKDFATETTQVALGVILSAIETKVATETTLASIKDTDGIKKITDGVQLNAGTAEIGKVAQGTKAAGSAAWPTVLYDAAGNAVTVTEDAGVYRVEINGKVSVVGALPPPSTTAAIIYADTPLSVGTNDTAFVIPNGETFHLQNITCGNEDPTKGASVTVLFDDGTEHVIARVYLGGQTLTIGYSDIALARDGTALVGNGTNEIIVRRAKFSGSNIAIDAVATGYTV